MREPTPPVPAALDWVIRRGGWLAAAVCAGCCLRYLAFTEDDSFIFYRYAENIAAGLGPVFNPGERVEGYTSPLWTLLLAAGAVVGLPTLWLSKTLGTLAAMGSVLVIHRLAWRVLPDGQRGWALWPALMVAVCASVGLRSASGMATPLFMLLWTATAAAVVREAGETPRPRPWSLLWAALLVWTRPDGALVFAVVSAWHAAVALRRPARLIPLAAALAVVGSLWVWRWNAFSEFFPNTYHAKATGPLLDGLASGAPYVGVFLAVHGGPVLLGALWPVARPAPTQVASGVRLVGVMVALHLAFVLRVGHDGAAMSGWRFLLPVLPVLLWLGAEGLRRAGVWLGAQGWPSAPAFLACVGACFVIVPQSNLHERFGYNMTYWARAQHDAYVTPALAVAALQLDDASVAMEDVGAFPYYSGLVTIDLVGLVDAHIAKLPGGQFDKQGFDPGYVFDREPTYIVLRSYRDTSSGAAFQGFSAQARAVRADPRLTRDYALLWVLPAPNAFLEYWVRRERPDAAAVGWGPR